MKQAYWIAGLFCLLRSLYSAEIKAAEYPALLGNGYDSLKLEHKMRQCVDGTVIDRPNIEYVAEFTKVENWSQLQTQMNFKVPGAIVVGSDSELAKFVLRARDTQYTSTYILQNHVGVRQKLITNPKIQVSEQDPDRFREECGTQYVSLTTSGGKLHVGIKFSFSDLEFKQEFDAGGAVQSITGLGAHVDALSTFAKKNSSVEIFFHQVGGNLSDLQNLFESGDIISCSLEKFDKCENLLKTVWNYSKNQFAKSVLEGKDQTISFQSDDYPNAPRFYENKFTKKERAKLLDALDQQLYDRDFLFSLKSGRLDHYRDCDDRCLNIMLSNVMTNIRVIRDAIRLSFQNPDLFKDHGRLSTLDLHPIVLPSKKLEPLAFIMSHLPILIPTGFVMVILPFFWKYFHFQKIISSQP